MGLRSSDWQKAKCVKRQEFVVGGFTEPGGSRVGVGSILVGSYEGGDAARREGSSRAAAGAEIRHYERDAGPLLRRTKRGETCESGRGLATGAIAHEALARSTIPGDVFGLQMPPCPWHNSDALT